MGDVAGLILALMWLSLGGMVVFALGGRALRSRRAAAALVATFIVAFALGFVAHRRGAPAGLPPPPARSPALPLARLPLSSIPAPGSIDRMTRTANGALELTGWIADPTRLAPGSGVFVLVDGEVRAEGAPAEYGLDRPDVARAYGDANLLWSGFRLGYYAPPGVRRGEHYLQVALISSDGGRAYLLPRRLIFTP